MISTVAELLERFLSMEAKILAAHSVEHRPTIGEMYEGLTKEALSRAIPAALCLRLVDGFVEGHDGKLSPQIDIMLVKGGTGRRIPHTTRYVWPINDVLAVFEIKKVLYAKELADGLAKMRAIWSLQYSALDSNAVPHVSIEASISAFARLFGRIPQKDAVQEFAHPDGAIFRTMVAEQISPVRVVYGFEGFANEINLREAFLELVESLAASNVDVSPPALPSLIVCRQNSLLKLGGHPYVYPHEEGWWHLIGSERKQPWRMIIDLIWTRLYNEFHKDFPMDDTLEMESFVKLLSVKPYEAGRAGWTMIATHATAADVEEPPAELWEPQQLSRHEEVIARTALTCGVLDLHDPDFTSYAKKFGVDLRAAVDALVEKRLFAWEGATVASPVIDSTDFVYDPDGTIWASNNRELLLLWLETRARVANSPESK